MAHSISDWTPPGATAETQGHIDAALQRYENETKPLIEQRLEPERVNHPQHYNNSASGVECIEVVREMTFDVGNAVKYLWRLGHKDDSIIELRKSQWYLQDQLALDKQRGVWQHISDMEAFHANFGAHIRTIPTGLVRQAMQWIAEYHTGDVVITDYQRRAYLEYAISALTHAIAQAGNQNE